MRLLHIDTLEFAEFADEKRPIYAIASHRWQKEEVTFKEVNERRNTKKKGYQKVRKFAKYIRDNVPKVKWLWIDTCCINKDSAAELSEAINLMFKWYRNAAICLAYLADVDAAGDEQSFKKSEWFERGWTLQELLAPPTVIFITKTWQVIGNKGASSNKYSRSPAGPGLEREIAARTGIPEQILHDYNASQGLSVKERLKWIEGRKTSRAEDMSYALFGIFGVTDGANYGEEDQGARKRLLRLIQYEENLAEQQAQRIREIAAQKAQRFQEIVAWLSPSDPWVNHKSARQRHESQTGTWLLDCDEYRDWKSASLRHLWVYGKAGCGKTVLCSTAIEDVKRHCESAANAGYAFFYLSFSDNQKQCYEDALLSWVAKLGWREPALSMLQQSYEKPNRDQPGQDDLEKILLACVKTYDEVFLVVDALDECPEDGDVRHYMMECLARLSDAASHVKILATSRELPDIRESMVMLGAKPVSIKTHSVDADIRKYMATQMSRDHRLSRLETATKALIENTISEKADGM